MMSTATPTDEIVTREDFVECRTLREVADTMARFCASTHPDTTSCGHGGPLMSESEQIRGDLIDLNQRGWVTTGSQPSMVDKEHDWFQRAAIEMMVPCRDYPGLLAALKKKNCFNYSTTTGDYRYDGRPDTWREKPYTPHTWYVRVPYLGGDPFFEAPGLTDAERADIVMVSISDVSPNFPRRLWDFLNQVAPPLQ